MATSLETIGDIQRPTKFQSSAAIESLSPGFSSRRKTVRSVGRAGSVSRTNRSAEFTGAASYRCSNADSSENSNNKQITSIPGSVNSSAAQVVDTRDPILSVVAAGFATGNASFAPQKIGMEWKTSTASSSTGQIANSKNDEGEIVLIEERRRKTGGDGYTTHNYTRGRLLGKGGFAKVYLCTAMDTGKHYAMKIVPKANLVKERARQKVRQLKLGFSTSTRKNLHHFHAQSYKPRSRFIAP